MTTSSRRSSGPVLPIASTFQRSLSPSGRFCSSMTSDATSFASSTSSSFCSSTSSGFFHRSASPTRVNLHGLAPLSPTPSMRMSIDRSTSPGRPMAMSTPRNPRNQHQVVRKQSSCKKTCLCSPTSHPGSFRCSLHKNNPPPQTHSHSNAYSLKNLTIQRSAMKNSLVRIGTVEGDLVKRALAALIRPSSHQIRRRADFQPKPSRLSVMSKAEDA
ncbi:hypothetical protein M9H77_13680 [Catharanthus roseus]|uniref:Uncharacterized protein n=1 Tax=Catharanthus roseus TaxID=4058 RepID=A0ACC0BL42_CATRO|nr:hypothetical protein M9H77_13680 [Catharanthus roseus]